MILNDECYAYCIECDKIYTNIRCKWCRPCQTNYLKENFTNWSSGNETIDVFTQKMQLKIINPQDIVFEWIPYNQFNDIREIRKSNFATAIWKDGPLHYNDNNIKEKKYIRESDKAVPLICLNSSQNMTKKFLNKV